MLRRAFNGLVFGAAELLPSLLRPADAGQPAKAAGTEVEQHRYVPAFVSVRGGQVAIGVAHVSEILVRNAYFVEFKGRFEYPVIVTLDDAQRVADAVCRWNGFSPARRREVSNRLSYGLAVSFQPPNSDR